MALIKDMLRNLEEREDEEAKPQVEENPQTVAVQLDSTKKASINYTMVSLIAGIGILVVLAIAFIFSPNYFESTKKNLYAAFSHATMSLSKKNTGMEQGGNAETKKTLTYVADVNAHRLYFAAVNLLNEGKVNQATHELEKLIKSYPNFAPAQQIYKVMVTKYSLRR